MVKEDEEFRFKFPGIWDGMKKSFSDWRDTVECYMGYHHPTMHGLMEAVAEKQGVLELVPPDHLPAGEHAAWHAEVRRYADKLTSLRIFL